MLQPRRRPTLVEVIGVELSPEFASVRPLRAAMFHATAPTTGELAGLLVGSRRDAAERWQPALDVVTLEAVIVHGVHLNLTKVRDPGVDRHGWPLFGRVRVGQTLVVYVRNDERELRELRAVLVLRGGESRRRGSRER